MAGKQPGSQNITTGNVYGIVGAKINVSGTGHRVGNTSTNDSHDTITSHSHNVYHAPVNMGQQHNEAQVISGCNIGNKTTGVANINFGTSTGCHITVGKRGERQYTSSSDEQDMRQSTEESDETEENPSGGQVIRGCSIGNQTEGVAQINFGKLLNSRITVSDRGDHKQTASTRGETVGEPSEQPRESNALEIQVDLPKEWPADGTVHDPHNVTVANVEAKTDMEALFNAVVGQTTSLVYPMQQKTRGVFLLINNKNFHKAAANRDGTDVDAGALEQLFDQLGFSVELHQDCTVKEMEDLIGTQFKKRNHKQYDCFACAILSHGDRGVVCGVDGGKLSLDKITDIVTGSNCQSLIGKPKLFIIQACQGDRVDEGIEKRDATSGAETDDDTIYLDTKVFRDHSLETPKKLQAEGKAQNITKENASAVCETDAPLTPSGGDILIFNSTFPGYAALRNRHTGSRFIQAFVYILSKYSNMLDMQRLMMLVKELVRRGKGRVYINGTVTETGRACQQPSVGPDSLNKQLFFFPGLTHNQRR